MNTTACRSYLLAFAKVMPVLAVAAAIAAWVFPSLFAYMLAADLPAPLRWFFECSFVERFAVLMLIGLGGVPWLLAASSPPKRTAADEALDLAVAKARAGGKL